MTEENDHRPPNHESYQQSVILNGKRVWCDREFVPLLRELNRAGLITRSHCCGHDTDPAWIAIRMKSVCSVEVRSHGEYDELLIAWQPTRPLVGLGPGPSEVFTKDPWQVIDTVPVDTPVLLWSEDWIDEDFNPSGVVDGFFHQDGVGWVVARWNDGQDCYSTREGVTPSHWAPKMGPQMATCGSTE